MSKPSQLIVVLEDDHQQMLVYRYLIKRGLQTHAIRIERSPAGEGSAENWVRKRFAKEVGVYHTRHAKTALIVVIDADNRSVQDRLIQLDQALKDGGKEGLHSDDQVARLVPKRNVETWVICLTEQAADEETDYKKKRSDWNRLISESAETLFQWTRANAEPPVYCVDSLRSGIRELNRLKF